MVEASGNFQLIYSEGALTLTSGQRGQTLLEEGLYGFWVNLGLSQGKLNYEDAERWARNFAKKDGIGLQADRILVADMNLAIIPERRLAIHNPVNLGTRWNEARNDLDKRFGYMFAEVSGDISETLKHRLS